MSSEENEDLKPFEYELPQAPRSVIDSWVTRLQAVAIVTALLAQVEASFISSLPERVPKPPASDTALRFFVYSGTILNLSATLSAVILLLAVTSVPTSARRIYMSCCHGFPRKVFLHTESPPSDSVPGVKPSSHSIRSINTTEDAGGLVSDMQLLNRHLLRGNTEGFLLSAFGIAQGWNILLLHCLSCFLGGCICSFVHVCIYIWSNEATLVSSILMPVAFVGFIPPLVVYFRWMSPPQCQECKNERRMARELDSVYVDKH